MISDAVIMMLGNSYIENQDWEHTRKLLIEGNVPEKDIQDLKEYWDNKIGENKLSLIERIKKQSKQKDQDRRSYFDDARQG